MPNYIPTTADGREILRQFLDGWFIYPMIPSGKLTVLWKTTIFKSTVNGNFQ